MTKYVYLAGPINGTTHAEANQWRMEIRHRLGPGIVGISPLRCEPLHGERYGMQYNDIKFGIPRAIQSKNMIDVQEADAVLAYLPKWANDRRPSYGTMMEIGWATALGKPVIVVTDDPNIAKHPVIAAAVNWLLPTLDDAVEVLHGLYDDYVRRAA